MGIVNPSGNQQGSSTTTNPTNQITGQGSVHKSIMDSYTKDQLATSTIVFTDSRGINHVLVCNTSPALVLDGVVIGGGSSYTFADSLVNTGGTVTLVGDSTSPTASQYYGTNSLSALGYYNLPTAPSTGNLTEATSDVLTITGGTGAVIGTGTTIKVILATSTTDGYLSSTDWGTFNGKQSALTFSDSIVNSSGTVTLVGDSTSPTASQYYGTNSLSALGYYNLPASAVASVTANANGTLTISPTTGAVIAGINLANANTWTGLQTLIQSTGVSALLISNNSSATSIANQGLDIVQDGVPLTVGLTNYGVSGVTNSPAIKGYSARGSLSSPAAVQAGDVLWSVAGAGYNGAAFVTAARSYMRIYATETWTSVHNGCEIIFAVTPNGSTIPFQALVINDTGQTIFNSSIMSNMSQTTLTGTSAGTVVWAQTDQGSAKKEVVLYANGYENTSGTAQTITFPVAFSHAPNILGNDTGMALTVSTTALTLPISMSATASGNIYLVGF